MAIYTLNSGTSPSGSGLYTSGSGLSVDFAVVGRAGFVQTVGDGASTSIVITHNLDTRDVDVQAYKTATPYNTIVTSVERTSVNTVTVKFAVAPATNEYTVVILPVKGN